MLLSWDQTHKGQQMWNLSWTGSRFNQEIRHLFMWRYPWLCLKASAEASDQFRLHQKASWEPTTDIFPLGELSLFSTRCLPSQHVYSLSLGLLLFNYSSHLADGDSVRFHQHLGSFSCPCFASLQRQTAASDLKITCWFSIQTPEWNRIWNQNTCPNSFLSHLVMEALWLE